MNNNNLECNDIDKDQDMQASPIESFKNNNVNKGNSNIGLDLKGNIKSNNFLTEKYMKHNGTKEIFESSENNQIKNNESNSNFMINIKEKKSSEVLNNIELLQRNIQSYSLNNNFINKIAPTLHHDNSNTFIKKGNRLIHEKFKTEEDDPNPVQLSNENTFLEEEDIQLLKNKDQPDKLKDLSNTNILNKSADIVLNKKHELISQAVNTTDKNSTEYLVTNRPQNVFSNKNKMQQ